jgi:hypothetical protein
LDDIVGATPDAEQHAHMEADIGGDSPMPIHGRGSFLT